MARTCDSCGNKGIITVYKDSDYCERCLIREESFDLPVQTYDQWAKEAEARGDIDFPSNHELMKAWEAGRRNLIIELRQYEKPQDGEEYHPDNDAHHYAWDYILTETEKIVNKK